MTRLCKLCKQYGSDKDGLHNYTPLYHALLAKRKITRMLEIGIGTKACMVPAVGRNYQPGASLRMWRDYFPDAEIWGWDIDRDVLVNDGRIHTHWCDQSDISSLEAAADASGKMFDLIVDDGSHILDHQVLSANFLYNRLTPGGLYMVEDMANIAAANHLVSLLRYPATVYVTNPIRQDVLVVLER